MCASMNPGRRYGRSGLIEPPPSGSIFAIRPSRTVTRAAKISRRVISIRFASMCMPNTIAGGGPVNNSQTLLFGHNRVCSGTIASVRAQSRRISSLPHLGFFRRTTEFWNLFNARLGLGPPCVFMRCGYFAAVSGKNAKDRKSQKKR